MLIKFLKSYDMWEDECNGWYDLYSIDNIQVYPVNDYDNTEIPEWVMERFEETLNDSKLDYENVILALYYDLIVTSTGNCTFLDTGGVFKKYDNRYKLSIVKLSDYC